MDVSSLKCIFYDFDGVMTDNRALIDQNGIESVFVNRSDGYGIAEIKKLGILQVILSTEKNPVVERRAEKLGIPVIHGVKDKGEAIIQYCNAKKINLSTTLFMGNDLNDLSAMKVVARKAAPKDAEAEILEIADWISERKGGYGAIRDLYQYIRDNRN